MEKIEELQRMIDESKKIVFFGGAGVSTESGIPDFRSVDGLYNQKYDFPPETILSHSFYMRKKSEFYKFYRDKILLENSGFSPEPNVTHLKLAEMEQKGKLTAIVTQNIDGLHQKAGSKCVYELHGTIMKNYCEKCHKFFNLDYISENFDERGIPVCDDCGGDIKPDVVLYEEGLDQDTIEGAVRAIAEADMLIIGGTSLVVYPAAGLIDYYRGNKLVLINKSTTPADSKADLIINESLGSVFSKLNIN